MSNISIIIDSREKKPLSFSFPVIVTKLDTGDYSLQGFEDKLCIERKGSINEWYQNCVQKRFWNEMDRTKTFPMRYLLLEFEPEDIDNLPYSLKLPKKIWSKMKINPKYIWKCLHRVQFEYQVITLFTKTRENSIKVIEDIIARINESTA